MIPRSFVRLLNAGLLAGLLSHLLWRRGPGRGRCYAELARPLVDTVCPGPTPDWVVAAGAWALLAVSLAWPAALAARELRRAGSRSFAAAVAALPLVLVVGVSALPAVLAEGSSDPVVVRGADLLVGVLVPAVVISLPGLRVAVSR